MAMSNTLGRFAAIGLVAAARWPRRPPKPKSS